MDIRNFFAKKEGGKKGGTKRVAPEESDKSKAKSNKKEPKKKGTALVKGKPITPNDFFAETEQPKKEKETTKKTPVLQLADTDDEEESKQESPRKKIRTSPEKQESPAAAHPGLSIIDFDSESDAEFLPETKPPAPPAPVPANKTPAKKPSPPAKRKAPPSSSSSVSKSKRASASKPVLLQPTRVTPEKPNTDNLKSLCLDKLTFCFSGVMPNLSREEATEMVKILGGRVTGNVSSKTHFLVLGEILEDGRGVEEGKKYKRAREEGTVVLVTDEAHFYGLLELYGGANDNNDKASSAGDSQSTAAETSQSTIHNPYEQSAGAAGDSQSSSQSSVSNPYKPAAAVNNPYATKNPYAAKIHNPYASKSSNPYASSKKSPPPGSVATKSTPSDAAKNVLWVDKHKPTNSQEILGNADAVRKLTSWLGSWERVWNTDSKKKKMTPNGPFKAALLSGPPGIGKTTTATVVATEAGRDVLEFNASDVRSKKALQQQVGDITGSQTIQFGGTSKQNRRKRCIIMDEVDGMGAGDRSGMAELIQMIKNSRVPIICICNDRQAQKIKSLVPYCMDLRYRRPTKTVIATRAVHIAQQEGMTVERNAVEAIADSCGNDMRQVLNCLQMWSAKNQSLSYKNVKDREYTTSKDEILRVSLFDATRTIVQGRRGLSGAESETERNHFFHRNDAYFVDYNFVGLMVHQNYLKVIQQQFNDAKRGGDDDTILGVIDRTYDAAATMSDWAMAEASLRGEQNWSLLPFTASLAVQTGSFAGGPSGGGLPGFPEFSTWLGRNSTRGKKVRLLGEIGHHLNASVSGGRGELRLSYIPVFRDRFVSLLRTGSTEEAIALMDTYGLSREDVIEKLDEFRLDPSTPSFDKLLDSKAKAALTRAYNQGSHTSQALVVEQQGGKPKRKSAGAAVAELKDPDAIDDDAVEVEEEVDDDMDAEAIKALFKSKKKGGRKAASKKAPAKKTPSKKKVKK